MKKIIHIQHCESVHHTNGMVGSSTDWELSLAGIAQAHNIGKKLKTELIEKYIIYTSDLKRAKMTADILNEYLETDCEVDQRLRERHLGEAVGKSRDWAQTHGAPYRYSIDHVPFVGAETIREHYKRVNHFLQEILSNEESHIIIVSHGGTKSVFQMAFLDVEIELFEHWNIHSRAGSVSKYLIQDDGYRRIESIGDTYYKQE